MDEAYYCVAWSSQRRCSVKKGVLRNFEKFTVKHLCQSLFSIKLQAWGQQLYLKKGSGTGIFLWVLRNFKEHLFFQNNSWRLLRNLVFTEMDKVIGRSYFEKSHRKLRLSWSCFDNLFIPLLFQKIYSVRDNSEEESMRDLISFPKFLIL